MRFWGSRSSECQDYDLLGCEFVSAKWRNLVTCYFYLVDTECMFLIIIVSLLSNCTEPCPRRLDSWCANSVLQVKFAHLCSMFVLDISCLFSLWWELPYVIILTNVVYVTEYSETFLCYTVCSPGLDHVSDCWCPVNTILQWFTCHHQLWKPQDDTTE
jgi:hypothetical protein